MDRLYEDIIRNAVAPLLRGRGIQIGGPRLSDEIVRVETFAKGTYKATGKEVTVPGDSLLVFSEGEMDYAVLPLTLEGMPDPVKMLRETRRVLKQGGELFIVAADGRQATGPAAAGHRHVYEPAFLARLVETACGFSIKALRQVGESGLVLLRAERDLRADVRIPFVTYTPGFVEAAKSPEGCAELYFNLGILYMQLGDTHRSLDSFQQVLAFEPESVEAHGGMGMAALCGGDSELACTWLEKAVAMDATNSDYRKWLELAMENRKEQAAPAGKEAEPGEEFVIPRPEPSAPAEAPPREAGQSARPAPEKV